MRKLSRMVEIHEEQLEKEVDERESNDKNKIEGKFVKNEEKASVSKSGESHLSLMKNKKKDTGKSEFNENSLMKYLENLNNQLNGSSSNQGGYNRRTKKKEIFKGNSSFSNNWGNSKHGTCPNDKKVKNFFY